VFRGQIYPPQNLSGTIAIKNDPDQADNARYPALTFSTDNLGRLYRVSLNVEYPGQFQDPNWSATQGKHGLIRVANNNNIDAVWRSGVYNAHEYTLPNYPEAGSKNWPTTIAPTEAMITVNNPTRVQQAQNMRMVTQTQGVPEYRLKLKYPPMTREEFRPYLAAITQARGQHVIWQFDLLNLVPGAFAAQGNHSGALRLVSDSTLVGQQGQSGSTVAVYDGAQPLQYQAVKKGDWFNCSAFAAGEIGVVTHDATSTAMGELVIRTTTPFRRSRNQPLQDGANHGDYVYFNGVLATDETEINISTVEHYGFELEFRTRNWER
jgi:hypothetical protein